MERGHDEMILHLPGTAEEKQWLSDHLETLSVRERIVLSAAMAREPPKDMTEAVNCLLSLDEYEVRGHVGNYAALGEFFLFDRCVPQDQQACFYLTALGYAYEEQHPGLLIRNCYVEYPDHQPAMLYDGGELPETEAEGWSVWLKLASEAVPKGVWVKLPDYNEINDGSPDFLERFAAVLEFEHCRRLSDAVNIADSLNGYDLISRDKFLDKVTEELSKQEWAKGGDAVKGCFDYAAYAAALAERQGYRVTGDERCYIRKRDSPMLEQQTGMTMQ